jgi:copper chaperone CopZ
MTHQMFSVKGMTCENCVKNISDLLNAEVGIKNIHVTLNPPQIHFDAEKNYNPEQINQVLSPLKKYSVQETQEMSHDISKYLPLILLFLLSAGIPALNVFINHSDLQHWMHQFMGATLIALAYFKFLDLAKFAEAFSTYDPIAMKLYKYGYVYPFFELIAGISFVLSVQVQAMAVFVVLFLLPTTYGVIKALRQKRKFQCACLGTAFNLPLTKITIVENILMMTMSAMIVF